jgi:hypothetical protein
MNADGGYVEVPFSNSLNLPRFTVEALVRPEWSSAETGLYRSVLTFCIVDVTPNAAKAFGFGLFAGPAPGALPGAPDVWHVWLGDGTTFKPFKDPNRDLTTVDFNRTNYLAVTYDDGGKKLNMYVYTAGIDLDSGVAHPLSDVAVPAYSPVSDPTQFTADRHASSADRERRERTLPPLSSLQGPDPGGGSVWPGTLRRSRGVARDARPEPLVAIESVESARRSASRGGRE